MARADVLMVSLGSTGGWRRADAELHGALERAGARVALVAAATPREVRTYALTDLVWARAARVAAHAALAEHRPRAIVYCTATASLLWPQPGAIRLDDVPDGNRPGRHGVWQRPVARRRVREAPLLVPLSEGALEHVAAPRPPAVVVHVPVTPSGPREGARDVAALCYAANPEKKGLSRVLAAWSAARRDGEELVVVGADVPGGAPGVRVERHLAPGAYRALLRRTRVFVTAPVREDYGIAQLEALADGCRLVTTQALGPYPALELARTLDPRLVGDDLARALRVALDEPDPGYAGRAADLLAPYRPEAVDRVVAEELLPVLLG